jgi:hypothetical protein
LSMEHVHPVANVNGTSSNVYETAENMMQVAEFHREHTISFAEACCMMKDNNDEQKFIGCKKLMELAALSASTGTYMNSIFRYVHAHYITYHTHTCT